MFPMLGVVVDWKVRDWGGVGGFLVCPIQTEDEQTNFRKNHSGDGRQVVFFQNREEYEEQSKKIWSTK